MAEMVLHSQGLGSQVSGESVADRALNAPQNKVKRVFSTWHSAYSSSQAKHDVDVCAHDAWVCCVSVGSAITYATLSPDCLSLGIVMVLIDFSRGDKMHSLPWPGQERTNAAPLQMAFSRKGCICECALYG